MSFKVFRPFRRQKKHLRPIKEAAWILSTLIGGFFLGLAGIYFWGTLPFEQVKHPPLQQATILYDRTGQHELYRLYDEANRQMIPHEAIPDSLRYATIASEDQRFYSHHGVDIEAVGRALFVNVREKDIRQGGSTITQQLARTLFLTREQTLTRKIEEMFLALKIERHFTKEEILDLYLNAVPYGSNAYGAETAARTFYGKPASRLTLDESALLAALPNAPTLYSPYGKGQDLLRERQKHILASMREGDFITQEEFTQAAAVDTLAKIDDPLRRIQAPHFVFYTIEYLKEHYDPKKLSVDGLKVYTTLDYDLEKKAEEIVRKGAVANRRYGAENAALVALDARNGEILAMVGSKDYFDQSIDGQVNITTSLRQPGSSFKPFAYAAAFESGFQPETVMYDIPIDFGPDGSGKNYRPKNYDGRFRGRISMREALAQSLNIPAVTTLALAGINPTIDLASRMGITTLTDPERYGLSLVLGGAEVRPLDMASAFGAFGQEGGRIPPTPILKIEKDGQEIALPDTRNRDQVLHPETARKINSILSDNQSRSAVFGSRSPLAFPKGTEVAAKTGTTQNNRDAWTVGYTSRVAAAVWAGNNDNVPMREGADGVYVAAPIWRAFLEVLLERYPETGFTAYTPQESPFVEHLSFLEKKLHYFNKKTGQEITEEEARELKKKRVETLTAAELLQRRAAEGAPSEEKDEESPQYGMTTLEAIRRLYEPGQTQTP